MQGSQPVSVMWTWWCTQGGGEIYDIRYGNITGLDRRMMTGDARPTAIVLFYGLKGNECI